MKQNRKIFRLTLASADVEEFLHECGAVEWYAADTGERVMTDEGADAEAVLLVQPTGRPSIEHAATMVH